MITKIVIENFKKFEKAEIEIDHDTVLFVGQNNGGKTTALQAVSLWSFLAQQWQFKKGKSKVKKRTGAPIPRNEVWASPVREMRMLWHDGEVQGKGSKKVNIRVTVYGKDNRTREPWEYGMEATYSNQELLFCKPVDHNKQQPQEINNVFHLPPLSGVQTSEKRIDLGAQLRVIGEGRPGEILRNLLWQLQENSSENWQNTKEKVKELFAVELQRIQYNELTDPDIAVYYKMCLPENRLKKTKLEVASAGSGLLQFLLLAAFLYVHKNSTLLIDEPDSHMHVFLQSGMYDWLQEVAQQNNSQLIISTHSEVLVNDTDLRQVYTFFGDTPRKPALKGSTANALKKVSPLDIINAEWKNRILFAEGHTDLRLLKAWAKVLEHPVIKELDSVNFRPLNGNDIGEAKKFFTTLKDVVDGDLRAFCLRDGAVSRTQDLPPGFDIQHWGRKEIENYLIHPEVLIKFIEGKLGELFLRPAKDYLKDNLPPKVFRDPLSESITANGSEFLESFFSALRLPINKGKYWEIAIVMSKEEIAQDVTCMLNKIDKFLKT